MICKIPSADQSSLQYLQKLINVCRISLQFYSGEHRKIFYLSAIRIHPGVSLSDENTPKLFCFFHTFFTLPLALWKYGTPDRGRLHFDIFSPHIQPDSEYHYSLPAYVVFCQVLFPEKSVGIPFFQQGIFPAFSGHYASLRMRACSIR